MCDPDACTRTCSLAQLGPGKDPRTVTSCVCDKDADHLAALIAEGYDQRTASGMLWPECWVLGRDDERETA